MERRSNYSRDHDLLISISTKIERVITDVAELKDNFVARVNALEIEKADKTELEKVVSDVRWLQRIAYTGIGLILFTQFYFQYLRK